jgi:hypothetical protein
LGQRDGYQHTRSVAQVRGYDVVIDAVQDLRCSKVAAEQLLHPPSHEWEKLGFLHDAAPHDDAFGQKDTDEVHPAQGQVLGLERPGRVILAQQRGALSPPRLQRWPSGQPLQTVAVVGTGSIEGVEIPIVGNPDVTHLRVVQAMDQFTIQVTVAIEGIITPCKVCHSRASSSQGILASSVASR